MTQFPKSIVVGVLTMQLLLSQASKSVAEATPKEPPPASLRGWDRPDEATVRRDPAAASLVSKKSKKYRDPIGTLLQWVPRLLKISMPAKILMRALNPTPLGTDDYLPPEAFRELNHELERMIPILEKCEADSDAAIDKQSRDLDERRSDYSSRCQEHDRQQQSLEEDQDAAEDTLREVASEIARHTLDLRRRNAQLRRDWMEIERQQTAIGNDKQSIETLATRLSGCTYTACPNGRSFAECTHVDLKANYSRQQQIWQQEIQGRRAQFRIDSVQLDDFLRRYATAAGDYGADRRGLLTARSSYEQKRAQLGHELRQRHEKLQQDSILLSNESREIEAAQMQLDSWRRVGDLCRTSLDEAKKNPGMWIYRLWQADPQRVAR